MNHCNKCSQRLDACSDCDVGADVQELRQRLAAVTAERDALKEDADFAAERTKALAKLFDVSDLMPSDGNFSDVLGDALAVIYRAAKELKHRAEAAEARIAEAENQKPLFFINLETLAELEDEKKICGLIAIGVSRIKEDAREYPLYSAPIPSPDTAENKNDK